jgi:transcriptional regulator with XRE-family HTH domain
MTSLPAGLVRRRPRRFSEWKALRTWGKLPAWEPEPIGYLLRVAREESGVTQEELARRLGCSQQAVGQAERWESNPTVEFMRRWARACGSRLKVRVEIYSPERKAEFLTANATDAADRKRVEEEVRRMGLDLPKPRKKSKR